MTTLTLYHGTPSENYDSIVEAGSLNGPVYLSPSFATACEYAANNSPDYVVFEVLVDYSDLNYDSEFVVDHCVDASLAAGSVFIDGDVDISKSKVSVFEDFEEVE